MAEAAQLRLLVDTDIGCDDAIALIMALRTPGVEVELVTTVAGNTSLENATRNALYVSELCGLHAPVCAGAARPLVREPRSAAYWHGDDGLGDIGFAAPNRGPATEHAIDALIQYTREAPGQYTLVALGPLTNLALALQRDAGLARRLRSCVVMGGAIDLGAPAEFNFQADAEAVKAVFDSGMPVTIVPIEHCRGDSRTTPTEWECLLESADAVGRFAGLMCRHLGRMSASRRGWNGEAAIPDAVAMAVAIDESLVTSAIKGGIDIDVGPEPDYGRLLIDESPAAERSSAIRLVTGVDAPCYRTLLNRALGLAD